MYDDICYSNSFLKEVIIRLDFTSPLLKLDDQIPTELAKEIMTKFPIQEPQKAVSGRFKISPKEISHEQLAKFTEWNFFGKEREKRFCITRNFMFISHFRYGKYEDFIEDFISPLNCLCQLFPETKGSRFGLRYINDISPKNQDPLDWSNLLHDDLLSLISALPDKDYLNRVFHIVSYNYDGIQIKFQFGMHNPDHPAVISRPSFILDLDGFIQSLIDPNDLRNYVNQLHEKIQRRFEFSIKDELRRIMNARS